MFVCESIYVNVCHASEIAHGILTVVLDALELELQAGVSCVTLCWELDSGPLEEQCS